MDVIEGELLSKVSVEILEGKGEGMLVVWATFVELPSST